MNAEAVKNEAATPTKKWVSFEDDEKKSKGSASAEQVSSPLRQNGESQKLDIHVTSGGWLLSSTYSFEETQLSAVGLGDSTYDSYFNER